MNSQSSTLSNEMKFGGYPSLSYPAGPPLPDAVYINWTILLSLRLSCLLHFSLKDLTIILMSLS